MSQFGLPSRVHCLSWAVEVVFVVRKHAEKPVSDVASKYKPSRNNMTLAVMQSCRVKTVIMTSSVASSIWEILFMFETTSDGVLVRIADSGICIAYERPIWCRSGEEDAP